MCPRHVYRKCGFEYVSCRQGSRDGYGVQRVRLPCRGECECVPNRHYSPSRWGRHSCLPLKCGKQGSPRADRLAVSPITVRKADPTGSMPTNVCIPNSLNIPHGTQPAAKGLPSPRRQTTKEAGLIDWYRPARRLWPPHPAL